MEDRITSIKTFSIPELEEKINEMDKELVEKAGEMAAIYAKRNVPEDNDTSQEPYISFLRTGYLKIGAYIQNVLLGESDMHVGANEIKFSDEQVKRDKTELEKTTHKLNNAQADRDKLDSSFNWKSYNRVIYILIGIGFFEALIDISAFGVMGGGLLMSIVWGFFVGFMTMLGAHLTPRIILLGKTKLLRLVFALGIALSICTLFLIIGRFRLGDIESSIFFMEATGQGQIIAKPWHFMVINMFFFTVASFLMYFNLPRKKDWNVREECQNLDREIEKLSNDVSALNQKINNAPSKLNNFLTEIIDMQDYRQTSLKQTNWMFHHAVDYLKIECVKRQGFMHRCFKTTPADLVFDIIVLNHVNEKQS